VNGKMTGCPSFTAKEDVKIRRSPFPGRHGEVLVKVQVALTAVLNLKVYQRGYTRA